jgi:hypothetical protein
MKKFVLTIVIALSVIGCASTGPFTTQKSSDCNQGKRCVTSYDCGEIGVCYCQYDWLEEQETGAAPQYGTCYFE